MDKSEGTVYLATKNIRFTYKSFLKILDEISEEFSFDEETHEYYRNRILDVGNDNIRATEEEIKNFLEVFGNEESRMEEIASKEAQKVFSTMKTIFLNPLDHEQTK